MGVKLIIKFSKLSFWYLLNLKNNLEWTFFASWSGLVSGENTGLSSINSKRMHPRLQISAFSEYGLFSTISGLYTCTIITMKLPRIN